MKISCLNAPGFDWTRVRRLGSRIIELTEFDRVGANTDLMDGV